MDAVQRARSGHPGMPMGMADVATVLFRRYLKFSAANPDWPDRDRFILSAGHGSMLLYALLHCCGVEEFSINALKNFRQFGSAAAGHPEQERAGVETTTGPLGQGLANAVGMALAERLLAAEFGETLSNHRTWVVVGDGCLMEGISHEAASLAGHLRLANLVALFDDNHISIDGDTALAVGDDVAARFAAYGWDTLSCDGHSPESIDAALSAACCAERPTLISCKTVIGFGAPTKQGTAATHGAPLGEEEIAAAREKLDWPHPPFSIPADILAAWREIGKRGDAARADWTERLAQSPRAAEFTRRMRGELPENWDAGWQKLREEWRQNDGGMATRAASGKTLESLVPHLPELVGGSADLTGSNNTQGGQEVVAPAGENGELRGGYIHYGVREHGMAAAMNGLALHGGFIPYGGTFLVFSDYCRPSIRLSAMTGARVIYVMTHDSIGLGEDGPTHQPIEHLAALRAMPNLRVWRPCDAAETAECWRLALLRRDGPSLLALSRQALPRVSGADAEQCARGGYLLAGGGKERQITLAASGSEIALALETRALLEKNGIAAAVVSLPCMELFLQQDDDWRTAVIPPSVPLLTIEAAVAMPWQALAAQLGVVRASHVSIDSFGMSAPAREIFEHFGFSAENCVKRCEELI